MAEKETIERARRGADQGKAASTQAGEFVREEIEHVRKGRHGARSAKQAIAIGLSKARRAGVRLPPPPKRKVSARTRAEATRAYRQGQGLRGRKPSRKRSRAVLRALRREGRAAASRRSLALQTRRAARRRGRRARRRAALLAVRTKGRAGLRRAATPNIATLSSNQWSNSYASGDRYGR
jgi:hypothetical protein